MKINKIIICIIVIILIILGIYITTPKNKKENKQEIINIENETTLETNKNIAITKGGTYKITGESTNSNITVDTEEEVTLVLDNVNLTNEAGPAITIENSKQTTITLLNENKISDGNNTNEDYNAVIYSKDNLTKNGTGTLEITTNFKDGIKSKDNLIIDANITINSKEEGIESENITIQNGTINIDSKGKGIKSDDEIIIENGNINIDSKDDGIHSNKHITKNNGNIEIK